MFVTEVGKHVYAFCFIPIKKPEMLDAFSLVTFSGPNLND